MTPLEQQFDLLKANYPQAGLLVLPSGAGLVTVPTVRLPPGWSQSTTNIKFLAPAGYPFAKPDCFWAEAQLRVQGNAMPQASNVTPIPETGEVALWFSWHTAQWNPNRDTLLTYFNVIKNRLREPR